MDQDKNTHVLAVLKYTTLLVFGLFGTVIAISVFRSADLAATVTPSRFGQEKVVPRMSFDSDRIAEGLTAPADTHIVFTMPLGVSITRVTLLGGEQNDSKRYWGYCFSGNEQGNKQKGYKGRKLYDGRFFYSRGERHAQMPKQNANPDIIDIATEQPEGPEFASEIEIFQGGETCYLMTEVPLPLGLDEDRDELNDRFERDIKSNPKNPDSDSDQIPDGKEVDIMRTSPISVDTDQDGLPDYLEDMDQNGQVGRTETSAILPDTDRDGLCDGDGTGLRCPEGSTSPVKGEDLNQNGVTDGDETDPRKADSDGNGVNDKDQRWLQYDRENGLF